MDGRNKYQIESQIPMRRYIIIIIIIITMEK